MPRNNAQSVALQENFALPAQRPDLIVVRCSSGNQANYRANKMSLQSGKLRISLQRQEYYLPLHIGSVVRKNRTWFLMCTWSSHLAQQRRLRALPSDLDPAIIHVRFLDPQL